MPELSDEAMTVKKDWKFLMILNAATLILIFAYYGIINDLIYLTYFFIFLAFFSVAYLLSILILKISLKSIKYFTLILAALSATFFIVSYFWAVQAYSYDGNFIAYLSLFVSSWLGASFCRTTGLPGPCSTLFIIYAKLFLICFFLVHLGITLPLLVLGIRNRIRKFADNILNKTGWVFLGLSIIYIFGALIIFITMVNDYIFQVTF